VHSLKQLCNFAGFLTLATFFHSLHIHLPKIVIDCAIDSLDRALNNLLFRHLRVIKTIMVINSAEIGLRTFVTYLRLLPKVNFSEKVTFWLKFASGHWPWHPEPLTLLTLLDGAD
jgi:hypothetical protein